MLGGSITESQCWFTVNRAAYVGKTPKTAVVRDVIAAAGSRETFYKCKMKTKDRKRNESPNKKYDKCVLHGTNLATLTSIVIMRAQSMSAENIIAAVIVCLNWLSLNPIRKVV